MNLALYSHIPILLFTESLQKNHELNEHFLLYSSFPVVHIFNDVVALNIAMVQKQCFASPNSGVKPVSLVDLRHMIPTF